ncbi:MAG: flotillin family protein [Hydrogeniiclostridium sp.]
MPAELIPILIVVAVVVLILILFGIGYVKAPPDTAYIISGLHKNPKILVGRAGVRIPFFERLDRLPLNIIPIDIKTQESVPTKEFINIRVDGVANVKISSDGDSLTRAAQSLLGKNFAELQMLAQQVLEGNMREIVGQMRLEDLVHDRAAFALKVQENAAPDIEKMGMEIVNLNIQNFVDENHTIENLGMDNVVQIQKTAAIAKAQGQKDIQIAEAEAKEAANQARINAEEKIAAQNTSLAIKQAELKQQADTKLAVSDAAYRIQEQEQRKTIEIASANADIARKEKEAELAEKEIALQEKRLDAEVRKQADAERYRVEQQAAAELAKRKRDAEADRYEREQEADSQKAVADAAMYSKQKEAEGIRLVGLAEAEAIEKKAEAMKKMGEASYLDMYLKVLPDIVKNAALPLAQTEKIVMYGDGNSTKLVQDVIATSNQVVDGLKEATGIDLNSLLAGVMVGRQTPPSPPQNAELPAEE